MRIVLAIIVLLLTTPLSAADVPRRGGILTYAANAEPTSFDCHAADSFSLIQSVAPFYSTLLQFDLSRYPDIKGDLAQSWDVSKDFRTYTFKLRSDVKFHDGSPFTSADVKASYERIIKPSEGFSSPRRATLEVISATETPDPLTVVFKTSKVDSGLLQHFASPWNCIYSAAMLKDQASVRTKVMGTGPFIFAGYEKGKGLKGERFDGYFLKDRPFLDGFRLRYIVQNAAILNALQSGEIDAEFRSFSPSEAERLTEDKSARLNAQQADWTLNAMIAFNVERKPFNDPRVRKALSLAIDRWRGSEALGRTSILKPVGGVFRPGSEFAASEAQLVSLPGYSRDMRGNRETAKALLAEAGQSNLKFRLLNRAVVQPYSLAALFLIDQWRQIGVTVEHDPFDNAKFFASINKGDFDATIDFSNLFMDDPSLTMTKYISFDRSPENRSRVIDRDLDKLYDLQKETSDPAERRKLLREFEAIALERAYTVPLLWWRRITVMSDRVKGWHMSPSHLLGQDLANVWLSD
jgi:peptide/nickel transport system substrate-binding protein